jgi:hypothetical protein
MSCVGFESTILTSERAKTVHALDRSATVTGQIYNPYAELYDKNKLICQQHKIKSFVHIRVEYTKIYSQC